MMFHPRQGHVTIDRARRSRA